MPRCGKTILGFLIATLMIGLPGSAWSLSAGEFPCESAEMAPNPRSLEDPEIDRSPIWAMVYGRYLYILGREMFWPDINRQDRFRIGVVNWPDLAEDLGARLDGRAIAGLPVDIAALEPSDLASERGDFTILFIGGSMDEAGREGLSESLARWMKRGTKAALVVTDGGSVQGHDLAFRRLKTGDAPTLCIDPDFAAMAAKSMELPAHFLQKQCP